MILLNPSALYIRANKCASDVKKQSSSAPTPAHISVRKIEAKLCERVSDNIGFLVSVSVVTLKASMCLSFSTVNIYYGKK